MRWGGTLCPMNTSRRALRHDVRDGLVRGILEGELGPGDRLIEMHIAKEYGTSQGPVREALRELEMLGFVRSEPHRGTYVRDPWQRGMLELYELRGALEEFAARMATPRLKDDVGSLQAEVDAMAAAARRRRRPCRRRAQRALPSPDHRGQRQPAARDGVEQPEHHRPHGADDGHPRARPQDDRRVPSADRRRHRRGRHRAGVPRQPRASGVVRGDAGRHGRAGRRSGRRRSRPEPGRRGVPVHFARVSQHLGPAGVERRSSHLYRG